MKEGPSTSTDDLRKELLRRAPEFGLEIASAGVDGLVKYYELVMEHNGLLHLVAPCSPQEFAVRHLLESLTLLKHLPIDVSFVDVGPGAGLPSIPCLLIRKDLKARLIESKEKKASFLTDAIARLDLAERAEVINKQFSETGPGDAGYVTCRALDRFTENLPRLAKWAGKRTLLLFGGNNLADTLRQNGMRSRSELMPLSEQRYLFVVER